MTVPCFPDDVDDGFTQPKFGDNWVTDYYLDLITNFKVVGLSDDVKVHMIKEANAKSKEVSYNLSVLRCT